MTETLIRPGLIPERWPADLDAQLHTIRSSQIHSTPTPATEEVQIIDIRRGGLSLNLADSIRKGFTNQDVDSRRSIPSLLLWDKNGLEYFEKVTHNPQYYLTNAEIDILQTHSARIAEQIEPNSILLELGSGALRKTDILLQAIEAQGKVVDYYALDLDHAELVRTLQQLKPGKFKHVRCHGLWGTYEDGAQWLSRAEMVRKPTCVLSLGSTIGGFTRPEAAGFLREWSSTLRQLGDGIKTRFIIGLDGNTDGASVWSAYNDQAGDNRRFVHNALRHANQHLGYTAFYPRDWTVQGEWDAEEGCHNQYLVPLKDLEFEGNRLIKGEKVHVCQSYKWNDSERERLWKESNLEELQRFVANGRQSYGMCCPTIMSDLWC
jgi:EasF-like predicted methyltransferase